MCVLQGVYRITESMILDRVEKEAVWKVRRLGQLHRRKYGLAEWKDFVRVHMWLRAAMAKARRSVDLST